MEASIAPDQRGPIKIDACAADYGSVSVPSGIPFVNVSQKEEGLVAAGFDFTNAGAKPVAAIRFGFRELDTFGENPNEAEFHLDWNGDVAVGQSFRGNRAQGYNLVGNDLAKVICFVERVRFADGSIWVGRDTYTPGLSYPPTPSPP